MAFISLEHYYKLNYYRKYAFAFTLRTYIVEAAPNKVLREQHVGFRFKKLRSAQ